MDVFTFIGFVWFSFEKEDEDIDGCSVEVVVVVVAVIVGECSLSSVVELSWEGLLFHQLRLEKKYDNEERLLAPLDLW